MTTTSQPASSVHATAKPLLRRPTLVRKRDETEVGSSPTPAKRAKVTFDDNVEVQNLHEWEKAPEVILEEVRRAIRRHIEGENSGYDDLKSIYAARRNGKKVLSTTTMKSYTTALLSNVSSLNKSCSDLVYAVLNSEWLGRDDEYVKIFMRLMANIVSSQGVFTAEVLRMLVENLTSGETHLPSRTGQDLTNLHTEPPSSGDIPDQPNVSRFRIYSRVHSTLRYLINLLPSASHTLATILASQFPHESDTLKAHTTYVQNLLSIIAYAPELRGEVLSLILDRLVKIDVRVQVDYEDLQFDARDVVDQRMTRTPNTLLEGEGDPESSNNEEAPVEDLEDVAVSEAKEVLENADKVDTILDLLFQHYDQEFRSTSATSRHGAIETLLTQFMTIILPTQQSRHTQFLIFHFAQMSPDFVDTFVGTCVSTAFEKTQPALIRQAGAAYLSSFVARGMHVPPSIVRDVFDYIGVELSRLRTLYEPGCQGPNLRRYSPYYCLVQALLYIFCFRWRDLEYNSDEDSDDGEFPGLYEGEHHWRAGVKETLIQNIFATKLNPLKLCQPDLVEQFAEVANRLGVIYVFGLIETNKRINVFQSVGSASTSAFGHPSRETALSARKDDDHHFLDGYFPFDPITLPKSRKWVEGDCREWTGLPGAERNRDDESESEMEEAGESDIETGTATDGSDEMF